MLYYLFLQNNFIHFVIFFLLFFYIQYHCGFLINPATLTAPSMILSDGSSSTSTMLANQLCEWVINPYAYAYLVKTNLNSSEVASSSGKIINSTIISGKIIDGNSKHHSDKININSLTSTKANTVKTTSNNGIQRTLVLEFSSSNLMGATIAVYDGSNTQGRLLWQCNNCNVIPNPVISISNTLCVSYSSLSNPTGTGFLGFYWEILEDTSVWQDSSGGIILDIPNDIVITNSTGNNTVMWYLPATTIPSNLTYQPRYFNNDISHRLDDLIVDGRVLESGSVFSSYVDTGMYTLF